MMILIGLDSECLIRCSRVCVCFSLLGLGYINELENGYTNVIEDG